jgi:amino acid transporter
VLLAWAAGNSLVFGEYILVAANVEPKRWTLRAVGFACITFAFLLHGTALKWGLRLQNFLGIFKILVLVFVVITGFVALGGHMKIDKPHNFTNAFEGTTANASSFCNALYNVSTKLLPAYFVLRHHPSGHLVVYWIQQRQLRTL